jgi:hypothetical protein
MHNKCLYGKHCALVCILIYFHESRQRKYAVFLLSRSRGINKIGLKLISNIENLTSFCLFSPCSSVFSVVSYFFLLYTIYFKFFTPQCSRSGTEINMLNGLLSFFKKKRPSLAGQSPIL